MRERTMGVTAVTDLELERYMGDWYEIARYENRFERKCVGNVMARYRATTQPGRITVENTCRKADGSISVAKGYGKSDGGGGRLKVSFFRPFWASYWVLALDPEYRWSLVGEPKREYLWILARTPTLEAEVLAGIEAKAVEQGFDVRMLRMTPQG